MTRYYLDVLSLAIEIHTELKPDFFMRRANRTVIHELVELINHDIRDHIHILTNSLITVGTVKPGRLGLLADQYWASFTEKYGISQTFLNGYLSDMPNYQFIFEVIDRHIAPQTFDVWVLSNDKLSYWIENLGDYRILEWEKEHIVDGRYVKNRIRV